MVAGLVVCLVLPLASWIFGRGDLAYHMYATTLVYRLEVVGFDADGRPTSIAPSTLAPYMSADAAPFVGGSERLREVPQIDALRAHLSDVARVACARAGSARVDVILFEGVPGAPTMLRRTSHRSCAER